MGFWTVTPEGDQCFDLLAYMFFQALVGYYIAKCQSLAGCSQEESFGASLSTASLCKNKDSCYPKASDAS